jgi:membrane-associated protease RseP (regulator of RpoE activity)
MSKAQAATRLLAFALVASATAAAFYYTVISDFGAIPKTILSVTLMVLSGLAFQRIFGLEGEWGLNLVRGTVGIRFMDSVAKRAPALWNFLADFGLVVGFGLGSLFLFNKKIPKKTVVAGMLFLMAFMQFVLPLAGPLTIELINLPGATKSLLTAGTGTSSGPAQSDLAASIANAFFGAISQIILVGIAIGGVALAGGLALLLKAISIIITIALFAFNTASGTADPGGVLAGEGPGATPVLPGINLPFAEGIIALAILLVVHEGAHGVLGRVAKIPLKSTGMVFLGILPFGAFVDPDEKKLEKTDADRQNRVLVAGSTANILTATALFFAFIAFTFIVAASHPGNAIGTTYVEVYSVAANGTAFGVLEPGMKILSWRGVPISGIQDFTAAANGTAAGSAIQVVTDKGAFEITAGAGGKVGVVVIAQAYSFSSLVRDLAPSEPWLPFLYNLIGITFVLNILVGMVNLLPIPPFDGYRILALWLKEKRIGPVKAIDAVIIVIVASFVINLLPWLWS